VYHLSHLPSPMTALRHLRMAEMYIGSVKGIETTLPALESLTCIAGIWTESTDWHHASLFASSPWWAAPASMTRFLR
jgi:hypothetical protein